MVSRCSEFNIESAHARHKGERERRVAINAAWRSGVREVEAELVDNVMV